MGLLGLLVFLAAGAVPEVARAYEETVTVGLDVGLGLAPSADIGVPGSQVGISASWGLNDAFTLAGRVGYGWHPSGVDAHLLVGGVEVAYLLDILQVVPFFGLGTDALGLFRGGTRSPDWALHAVAGLDWLVTRTWIVGLDVRAYFLPLDLDSDLSPYYVTIAFRVSMAFERY